ncbi:hypothetical protein JVU11DRAFT_3331 [Chiua virens]|nr:hypothetical protein JVU11DRAFT_3331 [Chiua virens]
MATMRAVLIKGGQGPIENLYIGDTDQPLPKEGEVLVKVHPSCVPSYMTNAILSARAKYSVPPGASPILGVEFSGVVHELGPGVTKWSLGDEVYGLIGGVRITESLRAATKWSYDVSTRVHTPSTSHVIKGYWSRNPHTCLGLRQQVFPKISLQVRTAIPCSVARDIGRAHRVACWPCLHSVSAYQALVIYGELKKGDDVLIHAGASGVGTAAIQIARVFGANTVTATASTRDKLNWLVSIPNGATHAVNYTCDDFSKEVKKTTNGKGVDVVIDFVGRTHWEKNIDSLATDGRMTLLSFLSGKDGVLAIRETHIKR